MIKVLDTIFHAMRFMPALPWRAWWALWLVSMAMLIARYVLDIDTLGLIGGFGFGLLAFTPISSVSYHVLLRSSHGGEHWAICPAHLIGEAICDERIRKIERIERRDGRIKRVESLPLPNRQ